MPPSVEAREKIFISALNDVRERSAADEELDIVGRCNHGVHYLSSCAAEHQRRDGGTGLPVP